MHNVSVIVVENITKRSSLGGRCQIGYESLGPADKVSGWVKDWSFMAIRAIQH